MSDGDSTRFSVKREVAFTIKADGITWRVADKTELTPTATDAANALVAASDGSDRPPPYLQSVIALLIEGSSIERHFTVRIQYLVVGDRFLISYDVIRSNGKPLSTATFDVEDNNAVEQKAFFSDLYGALARHINKAPRGAGTKDLTAEEVMATYPVWTGAGFIDHDVSVDQYAKSQDSSSLIATLKTTYRRHPFGEYSSAFSLPPFPTGDDYPAFPIAVAGIDKQGQRKLSAVVEENLRALETAMSLPDPKIIFVQGEPGSGKESFASAIHYGSRRKLPARKHPDPRSDIVTRSVAGMKLDQFKRDLFGEELAGGHVVDGRIAKAREKTLFLDEFDKFDPEAGSSPYAELLRVWEAKEYVPLNGRASQSVDDVNWVVAGAFTSTRRMSDLPGDIWSRFNAQITIKSPLAMPEIDASDRRDYIRALVWTFMLRQGLKQINGDSARVALRNLRSPSSRSAMVVKKLLFEDSGSGAGRLCPSAAVKAATEVLLMYIGEYDLCVFERISASNDHRAPPAKLAEISLPLLSPAVPWRFDAEKRRIQISNDDGAGILPKRSRERDSIRGVRQATSLIFSRLFEFLIQGRGCNSDRSSIVGNPDVESRVRQIFFDAFAAVDLTRAGSSPGFFMPARDWHLLLFGGSQPIIAKSLVDDVVKGLAGDRS